MNAPSNFQDTGATASTITWSWTDNSSNETGFSVWDGTTLVGQVDAGVTTWTETGLPAQSHTRYVKAQAVDGGAGTQAFDSATYSSGITGITNVTAAKEFLAVADSSGEIWAWEKTGPGTFGARVQLNTAATIASNVVGLAVADFNGDGLLDLCALDNDWYIYLVYRNSDVGALAASQFNAPIRVTERYVNSWGMDMAVNDIDRDGRPDVFASNNHEDLVYYLGKSDGKFTRKLLTWNALAMHDHPGTGSLRGCALGQFDGDQNVDLVYGESNSTTLYFWKGDGQGGFVYVGSQASVFPVADTYDIARADVNNDGYDDLLIPYNGAGNFRVYVAFGSSAGAFTQDGVADLNTAQMSSVATYNGITAWDVDDDGKTDVICASNGDGAANQPCYWYKGDGAGGFSQPGSNQISADTTTAAFYGGIAAPFNPKRFKIDTSAVSGGVFNLSDFTLGAGHTMFAVGSNPLTINVAANATVNGTLSLSGDHGGHGRWTSFGLTSTMSAGAGLAGGGAGGLGGQATAPAAGTDPSGGTTGGGAGVTNNGTPRGGGGGGYGTAGGDQVLGISGTGGLGGGVRGSPD
ncbi:MAG: VCBS repeat-containing protein, partial [Planctomycetes bacterium]|nr:VCBS repeat-containing protein [Planctomycetota bacterium]